jgi:hypothetical protein
VSNTIVVQDDDNVIIVSDTGPQGASGAGGGGSGTVTSITAGTGLTGGTITTSGTIAVSYGSTSSTACEGNDSRLSDARTPTTHSHVAADIGSVLGPGLLGRSAATTGTCERIGLGSGLEIDGSKNLALSTTPAAQTVQMIAGTGLSGGGTLAADRTFTVDYGTTANTACEGNDSRLSDARTPTSHTHPLSDLTQSSATTGQVPTWDGTAWAPATPSGGGGTTVGTRAQLFTHFISSDPTTFTATTSGGTSLTVGVTGKVGIWTLRTGTAASANQRGGLTTNITGFAFDDVTSAEFQANAAMATFNFSATSGEEGFCNIGFIDVTNQNMPTDGAFFRTQNGGNWYAVTRAASTETATDTGVLPDGTYRDFKIMVEDVGGTLTAKFWIDGTLKATHTTNIPTGSNQTGIGAQIVRTGSTGLANNLNIDWVYYDIDHADVTL